MMNLSPPARRPGSADARSGRSADAYLGSAGARSGWPDVRPGALDARPGSADVCPGSVGARAGASRPAVRLRAAVARA
ncbi:hypothetical protein GCM10029978_088260 [Actinoallomurus acanthiterrae]